MLSFLVNRASMALGRVGGPSSRVVLSAQLASLYRMKNGFRALDDALLVLPAEHARHVPGLAEWNASSGWRSWFELDDRITFFAMDIVMRQFGVDARGEVVRFDPVTEELETYAPNLDVWAERLIAGGAAQHLARQWQLAHRPLSVEERLLPSALGRTYSAMHLTDAMEQLGERAAIAEINSREYELPELAF
ncbi:MAG TPA: hypothetical protein VGD87_00890 [Archangium sp.]